MGFIGLIQIVTTSNYNEIVNLHNLQNTRAHTKSSQYAFTRRFLVTVLKNGDSHVVARWLILHK
jgi:hypothetical protein